MKPHHRIYFQQFAIALPMGGLLARLPDVQTKFSLTEGQLALLLIALSLGVLSGLTFLGRAVERNGARRTAFAAILGYSTFYALVPWMPTALLAAPLFFAAGLCAGALELNVNIETDRHEALLGRRIMSRVHGVWSVGFFVTALVAAALRQAGVSVEVHMAMVLIVVAVSAAIVLSRVENAPKRSEDHSGEAPLFAFPTIGLLPLCLIGAAPLFVEGSGIDWSAIYMRDVFAVEPFVGGMSVTLFTLAIAIGRLGMDPIADRFGARTVAAGLILISTIGLTMIGLAPDPIVALFGFALAGLGCSAVYPLAVSAAARRTDRPSSVNVASLGQMTFVVFFAGPPLLGFVAEHIGIRFSYLIVVPVLLISLLAIRALPARNLKVRNNHQHA